MNRKPFYLALSIVLIGLLFFACSKEHVNPYDQPDKNPDTDVEEEVPAPNSIAGLHAQIFEPTCANSGCHDGTFEPDFRSIESTYNNLVYHPIIKNDPAASFSYRVVPYQVDQSLLVARLTYDIDDNSGIMPLVVEPNSDWEDKKQEHLNNIKSWIEAGAPDLFGNSPGIANKLPEMKGVSAFGETWLKRTDGLQGALKVPLSQSQIDVYFALEDDQTPSQQLAVNPIKFSKNKNDFSNANAYSLELLSSPIQQTGYSGETVKYYHKISIQVSDFASEAGEQIYFRIYVKDEDNPTTEIPANGANTSIKDYFSFILIE